MAVDGMSSLRQLPSNFNQYPQSSTVCISASWWWPDRYFTSGKTVQKNVCGDGKEMKGLPTCNVVYEHTFLLELKWMKWNYGEVLMDKSAMYTRVTLTEGTWLYFDYFIWCVSCTVVVLTGFVMCVCFGNMCTCIYCGLYCLYCVFCIVWFMYI